MQFLVALVTPFDDNARIDLARLRAHTLWLAASGAAGFIVTDAAGEFPYLSDRERKVIHETVLDAAGDLPVFACTWDPSPLTTIYLSRQAERSGAEGIVVPTPLHYHLQRDVVARSYRELAEKVKIPLIAYHAPDLCQSPIDEALYAELLDEGVIGGMIDRSGDPFRVRRLAERHPGTVFASSDRVIGKLGGVDDLRGFVSIIANGWPSLVARALAGDVDATRTVVDLHARLTDAGGLPALKSALGMGCRMPLAAPESREPGAFPRTEQPR